MIGLIETSAHCPYCGEPITLLIDGSLSHSSYIEDCEVCCQPMVIEAGIDIDGELEFLHIRSEDETA